MKDGPRGKREVPGVYSGKAFLVCKEWKLHINVENGNMEKQWNRE